MQEASGIVCKTRFLMSGFFTPMPPATSNRILQSLYATFEKTMKREYLHVSHYQHVEQGPFSPLVFSSMLGGMGKDTSIAIKYLALSLSERRNEPYTVAPLVSYTMPPGLCFDESLLCVPSRFQIKAYPTSRSYCRTYPRKMTLNFDLKSDI